MDKIKNQFCAAKNLVTDLFDGNTSSSDRSEITRTTMYPLVAIGSLFDARKDSIVGTLEGDIQSKKEKSNENVLSIIYKGKDIHLENLLNILRIDYETRLTTILKLIEPNGIVSIINYSYSIDDLTRLIYYFEPIEEESLIYNFRKHKHLSNSFTHIISKIKFGISFVILLQLSPQESTSIEIIDKNLDYFTTQLSSNRDVENVISNEDEFLKNIASTKVYSNINDLSRLNNIYDVYRQIQIIRQNWQQYHPLSFILCSSPRSDVTKNVYIQIENEYILRVESIILPLTMNINILKKAVKRLKSSLKDHFQRELKCIDHLFEEVEGIYVTYLDKLKAMMIEVRSGQKSQEKLVHLLETEEQRLLLEKKDYITKCVKDLEAKDNLITKLKKKEIEYLNVFNTNVNDNDNQQTLEEKLIQDNRNVRIFCSNDHLKNDESDQWAYLLQELIKSRTKKKNLHLVYADFSYSSYKLEELKIIQSNKIEKKSKKLTGSFKIGSNVTSSKNESNPTSSQNNSNETFPKSDSTINILLFGESGVGKSTFINAFANYLIFDSIEEARSEEPFVIIPVSFLMTINDQFEERSIQFGRVRSNENHNNSGQSVTQHCKSYEWSIRNGKTLKIIDTPGFGDTRGQEQDEKNLNEIFSYIQNLTHLNALCVLLKPNVKELSSVFTSSLRQILQSLGDKFTKNIFFCFTNSQSTFFTIGDTGPILNKFLQSNQGKQLNLKKENTFCFDSESFRYLVASENSIQFEEQFIEQFEKSWIKSVKESNRLIDHICLQQTQYQIDKKWITIEQIKQEINHLMRPILEALRNTCRNMILNRNDFSKGIIELNSTNVPSSTVVCYKLNRSYNKIFDEIYIMSDCLHKSSDKCDNEHLNTNYKLNYQFNESKTDYSFEDANVYLYGMIKASANFDYFLNDNNQMNKDKSFLSGIYRMTNEEKFISEQEQSNNFNQELSKRLRKLEEQYQKDFQNINLTDEYSFIKEICSRIDGMKALPMIYQQLNPIQDQTDEEIED